MSEAWPIETKGEIQSGEIKPGRYKCNLMSIRLHEGEQTDWKTKQKTGKMEKKLIFDFAPVDMPDKKEGSTTIRYSISRWVFCSNSKKGGLIKLLTEMSDNGVIEEAVRLDPRRLQAFAEGMLGKGFMVQAGIPEKGSRVRVLSAYPDPTIPFREPRTKEMSAGSMEETTNSEDGRRCYSLGNETNETKKNQAISILKTLGAYEAQKDYYVTKEAVKELASYEVPMTFASDDIPF